MDTGLVWCVSRWMAQQARGSQRAPGDGVHGITETENLSCELTPEADHFYSHQRKYLWSVGIRWPEKVSLTLW